MACNGSSSGKVIEEKVMCGWKTLGSPIMTVEAPRVEVGLMICQELSLQHYFQKITVLVQEVVV